jgi:glycerol kinase
MEAVIQALNQKKIQYTLKAIGITNQRETTIAWNASTGKPYYNAIVWDDTRTTTIAHAIARGDPDRLRDKTGLPLASYFAGTKVKWLLDNVPELQDDLEKSPDQVRFGTIDTWVLYQLTGTPTTTEDTANVGGLFLTDVSNASRWLFCDIAKVQWDETLIDMVCSPHKVPLSALPEIRPSSQIYATCSKESTGIAALEGVPVAAILGDQQAALFGQCAFEPGEAKNTYGTGMFLMMNTGTTPVPSNHGLLTTIAYQLGDKVYYALEGSVSHSGSTIQWLRDQLKIISKASESETLASDHNDGLYFVPAFAGLFAPHWRSDARACIVGMTASHHKGHICRAALEAAAYQAREVFDAIYADSKVLLKSLKVDGGGTNNQLLMQFQADIINVPVVKPKIMETTAMGAAFCAGLAVGVWKDLQEIRDLWSVAQTFQPSMPEVEREKNWRGWQRAITKSLDWVEEEDDDQFEDAIQEIPSSRRSSLKEIGEFSARRVNLKEDTGESPKASGYSSFSLVLVAAVGVGAGILLGRHHRK